MKRIIPGILLAAFWLLILLYGPVSLFNFVVAAAAAIAADEYVRMTIPRGRVTDLLFSSVSSMICLSALPFLLR